MTRNCGACLQSKIIIKHAKFKNKKSNSNYFKAIVSFLLSSSIKIETLYCFISLAKSEQSKPLYKTKYILSVLSNILKNNNNQKKKN